MSESLFERAKRFIPGGVNSPVRAFGSVGAEPVFIRSARGPFVYDTGGREYVDYVGSWGPMILGHTHPAISAAVAAALERGTSFGACTEAEVELAERICQCLPSMDMVRLVNSGTEATMSAVRLARAATGRDLVVKFRGCYHGHADGFLVEAGSGALTFGKPSSPGVPESLTALTLLADYNDVESCRSVFNERGDGIAAVIVEPVAGNMGVVPAEEGFLQSLRELCDRHGALLIFDEVITGFRLGLGGAQERYGVRPDLTSLGKIIGGGLPVGAFGGRRDLMRQMSPEGPVYQAGTLSGNPLATAAGLAVIGELSKPGFYDELEGRSARWEAGVREALQKSGVEASVNRVASMMTIFFKPGGVRGYADAAASDTGRYARFFRAMLERGVYLAPSQFETAFLSAAHDDGVLDRTLAAVRESLAEVASATAG